MFHKNTYMSNIVICKALFSNFFCSNITDLLYILTKSLLKNICAWYNVFFLQNFQMSLKPPSASHEEDSSLDGYDPGQEATAASSPYHLSDGALSGHTEEHCTWDRQIEYILACCSFVNGIDTFLWFPKTAASYGGGISHDWRIVKPI